MEDAAKGSEYHDPDYPEAEPSTSQGTSRAKISEDERVQRIKAVVRREFANELKYKEEEIDLIDKRMSSARHLLHRLRYAIINQYYMNSKLMLSDGEIQDDIMAHQDPKSREEVTSILRNRQKRIHPAIRKITSSGPTELNELFVQKLPTRNKPRKDYSAMLKSSDSLKRQNSDSLSEMSCQSDKKRSKSNVDVPKFENRVLSLECTRNKQKDRFRIIIGNTSKYAPAASFADKSTHKWLLYVRGAPSKPEIEAYVTSVRITLHHTYAPHNTLHIQKAPFHLSRRGWGEFPAKIELHFKLPHLNRPTTLEHTIKLDRQYTGVQTLGAETVVDVWLYTDAEMQKHIFNEEDENQMSLPSTVQKPTNTDKCEPPLIKSEFTTSDQAWTEFENSFLNSELNVDDMLIKPVKKELSDEAFDTSFIKQEIEDFDSTLAGATKSPVKVRNEFKSPAKKTHNLVEVSHDRSLTRLSDGDCLPRNPKKRLMKYVDPNTNKVYYLEMDVGLNLDKVQGIIINAITESQSKKNNHINGFSGNKAAKKTPPQKKGISLLKPEFQKAEMPTKQPTSNSNFTHFHNDHCYMGAVWTSAVNVSPLRNVSCEIDAICSGLINVASRLKDVRQIVMSLLRKLPLINALSSDPKFKKKFPFVVESDKVFWSYDSVKRRNWEWSRAKLINTILMENFEEKNKIWTTKQILTFARYHGFHPTKNETEQGEQNVRNRSTDFLQLYGDKVSTLSILDLSPHKTVESDVTKVINLTEDGDEEIDIVNPPVTPVKIKQEVGGGEREELEILNLESEEEKLRCYFIEKKCSDLGIELRNENIGSGYSHCAVHKVLLHCMKLFAEEIIRSGVCRERINFNSSRNTTTRLFHSAWDSPAVVELSHIFEALKTESRLKFLTLNGLGSETIQYKEKL